MGLLTSVSVTQNSTSMHDVRYTGTVSYKDSEWRIPEEGEQESRGLQRREERGPHRRNSHVHTGQLLTGRLLPPPLCLLAPVSWIFPTTSA